MRRERIIRSSHLLMAFFIFISTVFCLTVGTGICTVQAANPTMEDIWNGNAHLELYMDRPMGGQDGSGSNIVVVGNTWYWFHRVVTDNALGKLGTVCEKSTDKGLTWSKPVTVLQPEAGTPWARMVTDGSFWYDETENKWRALMQSNDGVNPWTMSYFERTGSDPMGIFSTPSGFANPGCDAKEIWSQLTTAPGKDCVDIAGGSNLIYDEGTPQIVLKSGNEWYVTFHGASNNNGVIHGYRGLAKTSDFQNWTALAGDCIVDEKDAKGWNVEWNNTSVKAIGAGAANIMKEGSYFYQIIECPDSDLNGFGGQNWPIHLMRSSTLENTSWTQCPNTYPLFPATQQLIEWQYPTIFKDIDGITYVSITRYGPDSESGFRIYKVVTGGGPTTPAIFPSNNVVNPSFEGGSGAWTFGSSMQISNERPYTGAYSLKTTVNGVNAISNKIFVKPNTDYILSGYIYKTNSNGNVYLDLNDIAGEAQPTVVNGNGAGVWTFVSQTWNSGSNSFVNIRCAADNGINADAFFDDVSLVRAVSDSFEPDQVQTTWSNTVEHSQNVTGYSAGIIPECSVRTGEKAHTGTSALMYSGYDNSTSSSYCRYSVFDVDIPIFPSTKLSYWFYPEQDNGRHVTVDFVCTDGSTLRGSGATDQNNISMNPANARGSVNTWNYVNCNIGQWLNSKTIDKILVSYDQSAATGQYRGYIDDLTINTQSAATEQLVLKSGQILQADCSVKSGKHVLKNQLDGNLVIYSSGTATWSTDTNGQQSSHLDMQADGNLVLYKNTGGVTWASNTAGTTGRYYCTLTKLGKLKIYKGTYPNGIQIWSN